MPYTEIRYEQPEDGIAVVTLERPEVLNAVNLPLFREIKDAAHAAERDENVAVLIFRGSGRAFCVGRDFKYSAKLQVEDPEGWWAWRNGTDGIFGDETWRSPNVTIAQVQGYALGLGCHLATQCDLTVAADGTKFGYPDVRWGGVMRDHPWNRLVGPKKMKEYMFTGRLMDANEACVTGVCNQVVPNNELEGYVLDLARDMVTQERKFPGFLRAWKDEINRHNLELTYRMISTKDLYEESMRSVEFGARTLEMHDRFFERVAEIGVQEAIDELHKGFSSRK
jgi:enoyl-CoA hydratase/carnithine racemase